MTAARNPTKLAGLQEEKQMNKKMVLTKADRQYIAGWFSFYKECTSIRFAGYLITRETAQPWMKRYNRAVS